MATPVREKREKLCRYFIRYGDCFHGENCQFTHAYPPQSTPIPQQPVPQTTQQLHQQQHNQHQQQQHYQQQLISTPQINNNINNNHNHQSQSQDLQSQQQQQQQLEQQQYQDQNFGLNKLICSFKSDLPNEIDFAMQVATLLANTENFTWSKDYQLVEAICSSLHVFTCICGDTTNCYCYPKFWHKILTKNFNNIHLQAATLPFEMKQSFLNFASLEDHDLKDHSKIYRRIKAVAELIKQFSMTASIKNREKNNDTNQEFDYHQINNKKKKLKASPSLLKFVSLLYQCDDKSLNLIGLDILSNIAPKLSKIPDNDPTCLGLVQMFQEHCIDCISRQDGDIYEINRSIEVVSRLISSSSKSVTTNVIKLMVEKNIVLRVEQFLTSHYDVTLFLSALECCYRISRHQAHLLLAGRARYLMKILVNLLNFEDNRYFTTSALKKVKLVDEKPFTTPAIPQQQQQTNNSNSNSNSNNINIINRSPPLIHQSQPTAKPPQTSYTCEWNGCKAQFTEAKRVYIHVFEEHIGKLEAGTLSTCLWSGPEGSGPGCLTKRPKFSLLTHLNDFHCSPMALERGSKPPVHPGYASNAALLAIRRHANAHKEPINGHLRSQTPLSTSVRLTAALILRNLAIESSDIKQALKSHEFFLSEICMSSGDESKIIAECLGLISKD